ncbi:ankyrin repeat protein [Histoplasma capsulatum G186AR]|uniref:Ankyrin repeat protein n=2 Tax=Ajellomyces capsulatus TaxID=5037 RepID=C0NPS0_AJECG|nr:ankyrin repeat protein [Histoplasma capsulatum G186AR]EEH06930.1 ankyrin repeat protein [Histoplasma capsulatum G186AR]KAG5294043.1 ankyrin repeat protein [Histoplasma capsulatum]QSS75495.1 ankyrin repeat protein [Histoplasma capsulatum G186AR]
MRFSRLLCCGGPDDNGEKASPSPPPAYRSIDGNPDASKQSLPIPQHTRIAFNISPPATLPSDPDAIAGKANTLASQGRGDLRSHDSHDAHEHERNRGLHRSRYQGPAQKMPGNTFLMPNGQEITLNTNDDLVQATLAAAQTSDQALDQWLDMGYGIEIRDSKKRTAAMWAVLQNRPEAVRRLVERGAQVNLATAQSSTELHHAVSEGDRKRVATLLQYGADVNAADEDGNTPLHCALNRWLKTDQREDFSVIKSLVGKGANLEAHNRYGNTLLHEACIYADGVRLRFMAGSSGPSPTATSRRLAMATALLDLGMPVDTRDKWGSTPLLRCCTMQSPDRDVIALLLDRGADVNAPNNHGDTPLDTVCFQPDTELLKQVAASVLHIDADADTNANANTSANANDDDNANDNANDNDNDNDNDKLNSDNDDETHDDDNGQVIDNQPDPATAALFNKPTVLSTPLHYAAQHSGPDRLLFLLTHGANPSTPTYATGATPLHLLASSKPSTTDKPSPPSPSTPTVTTTKTLAPATDHITQKIHLLISHGADVNARDLTGATPLHYAARNVESRYQERIVAALLAAGAEPDCKDAKGRTPLRELEGYWVLKGAVVKRLLEAGAQKEPGMEGLGAFEYMDRDRREGGYE